jgi:Predicted endonuclease containing a URI domain
VLQSLNDVDRFYIGQSGDLRRRVDEHNKGASRSTRHDRWRLVYYEAYASRSAAIRRERILKHDGRSRRALMERVRASL